MYTVNPFPPPFGVCSICQKHDCGVSPDGEKWIQIPLELFIGGDIHVGYKCIKSMSDNLGIAQEIVEREVLLTPTVEQIGEYVRKAVFQDPMKEFNEREVRIKQSDILHTLDRNGLKDWMVSHNLSFVPQWGEERLREEALKHV
jgi:hypothetical protein